MTTDEKRIALAKWMGQRPEEQYVTLDSLHECEKKLNEEQQVEYLIQLEKYAYGGPKMIKALYRIHASAEQRLDALVATLGLSTSPHATK